jgi:hypothetical protein
MQTSRSRYFFSGRGPQHPDPGSPDIQISGRLTSRNPDLTSRNPDPDISPSPWARLHPDPGTPEVQILTSRNPEVLDCPLSDKNSSYSRIKETI